MKISFLTLFPEMFTGPLQHSILKRAQDKKLIEFELVNIRDFGIGKHKSVDDTPYGGGIGMIMRVDVLQKTIEAVKQKNKGKRTKVILMDARGKRFDQKKAREFIEFDHVILIAGHYEGVDERVYAFIDEAISIGDYVLTGGELPALIIADAVTRLIPGVITQGATETESFSFLQDEKHLLEYPQYTRPAEYMTAKVPAVLLSGDHRKILEWRNEKSLLHTKKVRPDLLRKRE